MTGFEVPFGDGRGSRGKKRPIVVGLVAVTVLVVGVAVWAFFSGGQSFEIRTGQESEQALTVEEEPAQEEDTVLVHVAGAVANPGVYEVIEGSRVAQAVEAAGGFAEGAASDALNLARVVADGEQIVVPTQAELEAQGGGSLGSSAASSGATGILNGKVNINTATAEQLDSLPGIGASTAEKIIADREANGPFVTCEDLMRVSGIGEKKYAALSEEICVG